MLVLKSLRDHFLVRHALESSLEHWAAEKYSEKILGLLQARFVGFLVPCCESFQCDNTNLVGHIAEDSKCTQILLGVNCGLLGCTLLAFGVFAVSADVLLVGFWMAESNKNQAIN